MARHSDDARAVEGRARSRPAAPSCPSPRARHQHVEADSAQRCAADRRSARSSMPRRDQPLERRRCRARRGAAPTPGPPARPAGRSPRRRRRRAGGIRHAARRRARTRRPSSAARCASSRNISPARLEHAVALDKDWQPGPLTKTARTERSAHKRSIKPRPQSSLKRRRRQTLALLSRPPCSELARAPHRSRRGRGFARHTTVRRRAQASRTRPRPPPRPAARASASRRHHFDQRRRRRLRTRHRARRAAGVPRLVARSTTFRRRPARP